MSQKVILKTFDNHMFRVDVETAKKFSVISNLLENLVAPDGSEKQIPVPKVRGEILKLMIQYAEKHKNDLPATAMQQFSNEINQWYMEILKAEHNILFELALGAKALEFEHLLESSCQFIANTLKNKSPAEIGQLYKYTT